MKCNIWRIFMELCIICFFLQGCGRNGQTTNNSILVNETIENIESDSTILSETSRDKHVSLNDVEIAEIPIQNYTASSIIVDVSLTYNGRILVKDQDYTLAISDNVLPGDANVEICGIGLYTGVIKTQFQITLGDEYCDDPTNAQMLYFVEDSYESFLGRLPTREEWILNTRGLGTHEESVNDFLMGILHSDEYRNQGESGLETVAKVYRVLCAREMTDDEMSFYAEQFQIEGKTPAGIIDEQFRTGAFQAECEGKGFLATKVLYQSVSVTDAFELARQSDFGEYISCYHIPKLTIEGVDTSEINKIIYDENIDDTSEDMGVDSVEYAYWMSGKIITIYLYVWNEYEQSEYQRIYNIDIETGVPMNDEDVLKTLGIPTDEYYSAVREIYTKLMEESSFDSDWVKQREEAILSDDNMKYAKPFIGPSGRLCVEWGGTTLYEDHPLIDYFAKSLIDYSSLAESLKCTVDHSSEVEIVPTDPEMNPGLESVRPLVEMYIDAAFAYYDDQAGQHLNLVVFDSEIEIRPDGYTFVVRSQDTNLPNVWFAQVEVNVFTEEMSDEWGNTWSRLDYS